MRCNSSTPQPIRACGPRSSAATGRGATTAKPRRSADPTRRTSSPLSPKLRCGGWVDSWLNWGFVGLVGRRFWLRGGQGDWGADEVEGAALVGGGFGEHGDVGVGVVVADLVAGQGGQVSEQAAEAAQWGAVEGLVTGGFGLGGGGALCGGDWVVAAGWVLVGESQWRPGVA